MSELDNPNNVLGTFSVVNDFDKNQKDRVKNILLLNGLCEINHKLLVESYEFTFTKVASFFSSIVHISNLLLTWQINDEITASLYNRGPTNDLIKEIVEDLKITLTENNNRRLNEGCLIAIENLCQKTFHGEYTEMLNGSSFLDFTVTTYSAFEFWMCRIFDQLHSNEAILKSREDDILKKIFGNINNIDDTVKSELAKQIVIKFCPYVSSKNKIDKVLSIAKRRAKEDSNSLEITKLDRDLVTFYSCLRNSIHNLGYHSQTLDISFYGVKIEQGKASYFNDRSDHLRLCIDLCDLYSKIVNILDLEFHTVFKIE